MSNTETKFCKNCKFFEQGVLFDLCVNPVFPKLTNMVTGDYYPNFCSDLRMEHQVDGYSYGLCGPEAQHYEKRLSWWEKLWN